jgi:hypothetical protein
MSRKRRIDRLEEKAYAEGAVPLFIIMTDSTVSCGDPRVKTPEDFERIYGEQIERERARGRKVFGVDFRPTGGVRR